MNSITGHEPQFSSCKGFIGWDHELEKFDNESGYVNEG
jgi:hypothetical protein